LDKITQLKIKGEIKQIINKMIDRIVEKMSPEYENFIYNINESNINTLKAEISEDKSKV
jgi:hypothetical protein